MKIDADEKELLESVERGEWKSAGGGKRERARFSRYAKATFKKDRRLNIRLSSKDLEAIQKRALAEGLAVSDADREPAAQVRSPAASKRSEERQSVSGSHFLAIHDAEDVAVQILEPGDLDVPRDMHVALAPGLRQIVVLERDALRLERPERHPRRRQRSRSRPWLCSCRRSLTGTH